MIATAIILVPTNIDIAKVMRDPVNPLAASASEAQIQKKEQNMVLDLMTIKPFAFIRLIGYRTFAIITRMIKLKAARPRFNQMMKRIFIINI